MLSIILMILKIIGIALLVILGIILFIVLAVLLVPVRYSFSGDYHERLKASAGASWFLHLISVTVDYDGSLDYAVRLFGIPLIKSDSGKEEKNETPKQEEPERPKEVPKPEQPEEAKEAPKPEESESEGPKEVQDKQEPERPEEPSGSKEPGKPRNVPEPKEPVRPKGTPEQKKNRPVLTDRIKSIENSFDNFYKKIVRFKDFVSDPVNQKSFKLIVRQVKAIIKHILPTKLKGDIAFGFDDPATTGNVLCACSIIYAMYGDNLVFTPVFDDTVTEGDLAMSGRIRIGTLIVLSVRLLLDKNIRTRLWE